MRPMQNKGESRTPSRARLRAGLALAALLGLSACGGEHAEAPPPENFEPLKFDYLTKLHLRAGSIDVADNSVRLGPSDLASQSPVPPAQALTDMAHARLFAAGLTGRAEFSIDQASIIAAPNGELDGQLLVHVAVFAPDGTRAGFAQARVAKVAPPPPPESEGPSLRARLYGLTRQMMDSMNVELEYQVRHDLGAFLESDAVVPGRVTAAPLDNPAPAPGADGTAAGTPAPGNLAPTAGAAPPAPQALPPTPEDAQPPAQMSPPPGYLHLPDQPPPR